MLIATHEGLTLRRLDMDTYCLTSGQDTAGRCSGAIIGANEAKAVLSSWGMSSEVLTVGILEGHQISRR